MIPYCQQCYLLWPLPPPKQPIWQPPPPFQILPDQKNNKNKNKKRKKSSTSITSTKKAESTALVFLHLGKHQKRKRKHILLERQMVATWILVYHQKSEPHLVPEGISNPLLTTKGAASVLSYFYVKTIIMIARSHTQIVKRNVLFSAATVKMVLLLLNFFPITSLFNIHQSQWNCATFLISCLYLPLLYLIPIMLNPHYQPK